MTNKPISTISYNSIEFLKEKLDQWVKSHIIQCYMFIQHKGEDGDKNHIHLRVEPNKKLDPMCLSDELLEYPDGYGGKPLGCRPWRPSNEEDWFLYAVHNEQYLKMKYGGGDKGEKLPYDYTDIVVNSNYDLECAFVRALAYLKHSSVNLATRLRSGENAINLLMEGENVHTVNAILNTLQKTDYTKLVVELQQTQERLSVIERAVYSSGYTFATSHQP